ncbi:hypothetical protein HGRIS_003732 [Hohenbuehelia grisea]|uniref:Uncharacterized protein n=1 Tax=Hohenbuehelia grisea TaxID=104357 RepID=A0ABR3JHA7_9AGAR
MASRPRIPKFSNPHFLPEAFKGATRAELFWDSDLGDSPHATDEAAVAQLDALVKSSIDFSFDCEVHRPKKRRKKKHSEGESLNAIVEFRLISGTAPPAAISLGPKPLPPTITREPPSEDTPELAKQRRWQAQQAAVDADWLAAEAHKLHILPSQLPPESLGVTLSGHSPVMLVIQKTRPPRFARPPLPPSQLSYPYVRDAPIPDMPPPSITSLSDVAFVEQPRESTSTRRRRRARMKVVAKVRPQPTFWRPNAAASGKSLGYGYGYPARRTKP